MECPSTETKASGIIPFAPYLTFSVVREITENMHNQIQAAVTSFIHDSHMPEGIDLEGFRRNTLQAIASATIMGQGGDFWMATKRGELVAYVLASIGNNLDGKLAYQVSQAWVRKDYRRTPIVREWWGQIKERARNCMCGHLVIMSSRNPKAYERFLGDGVKKYADLLKMSL